MPRLVKLNGSVGISLGGSVKRKRRHPNCSVAFRGSVKRKPSDQSGSNRLDCLAASQVSEASQA